jgi:hypothetical protein
MKQIIDIEKKGPTWVRRFEREDVNLSKHDGGVCEVGFG